MKGYWKRDDATADTITAEGYLHTGDVGYQDEDGFIYLVDRIKDLILCSGYNVYPRVIEEAIYQNEAVDETIVIAIPDEYRGQSPKAFIKLKEGYSMTGEDMKTFLTDHLSSIEMPREFEFRDELPKTMVGKLSKKELVEEEAQKRAQTEAQSA
jgi:long-chain acyl-CoA synthetase